MTRKEKIEWMAVWAAKNDLKLELKGECGFGRDCVGVVSETIYPDYDRKDVWIPEDAYHKHNCVAVLGHGKKAEDQLYKWLKWFDDNGYTLETGALPVDSSLGPIQFMLGKHRYAKMVKK